MTHTLSLDGLSSLTIPLRHRSIRIFTTLPGEDPEDRILLWWGITSASVGLGLFLEKEVSLEGKSVLELGCGLGLAGVTAALLGADVTFSDYVPEALQSAVASARLNGIPPERTHARHLDWEDPGEIGRFDVVIGAEIAYDYYFHGPLVSVVERVLAPHGAFILADRKRLVVSRFLGRLAARGFGCREDLLRVETSGFPVQEISIFTMERQPG